MHYNLLVTFGGSRAGPDSIELGRVFEYTRDDICRNFSTNGVPNLDKLSMLPCLFIPEEASCGNQPVRMGSVSQLAIDGNNLHFIAAYDETMPSFDCQWIWDNRIDLGFNGADFQRSRSHWAVNPGNLHELFLRHLPVRKIGGSVLNVPDLDVTDRRLVSVMMPFRNEFNPVYEAIETAAVDARLRCERADNIWNNDVVLDDIVELIARGKIVVCDLTGKNANVFYETGIAHTLGKDVILLTQSMQDVPFDLRHRRILNYLPNGEGLAQMRTSLSDRFTTILRR